VHHTCVTSRAILVPYDGTGRAELALEAAIVRCRESRARLGLSMTAPWFATVGAPWLSIPALLTPDLESAKRVLGRIPDDVLVRFLLWPYPAGGREIAQFARRLDCDSVLLPFRGSRARHIKRTLSRRGLQILEAGPAAPPTVAPLHGATAAAATS